MSLFRHLLTALVGLTFYTQTFGQNTKAIAKIDEMTVTCDNLTRDIESGYTTLEGHVTIAYKDQLFKADKVIIDQKNKKAQLQGNVSVKNSQHEVGGDDIFLDYENNQAQVTEGFIRSNNIYFVGSSIEQKDAKNFLIKDAEFTTCSNCPPTLSYQGTEIEAEMGGYAFIKNSFLRIYGVPVFWLPYLIVPLNSERQTGLLAPEIGATQERGFTFSQSLFIAISRSQDMTLKLTNYSHGGLKKQIEYRYVLDPIKFGEFTFSHINDSLFNSNSRYTLYQNQSNPKDFQRWSLRGYNQYNFNDYSGLLLNLNLVSDVVYPKDFFDEFPNYADSGLENRITYNQELNNSLLNINAIYYKHLLTANALSDNAMAVHKLPEVNYLSTIKPIANTPFYYKFNLNYAYFFREKSYDDITTLNGLRYASNTANDPTCENNLNTPCTTTADQQFNDGTDLIRSGQRLNYKASLLTEAYPLGSAFTLTPEISFNESHYLFPVGKHKYTSRRYIELDAVTRARYFEIYDSKSNLNTKYKHELIPEVSYRWIPWDNEDQNDFFGTDQNNQNPILSKVIISDDDLKNNNSVQFDYTDRLYDRHLITLTLLNRVIKKDNSIYSHLFDFQIKQSYDVYQALYGKNKNQPLSDLSSIMNLYLNDYTFSNQTNYYPYQNAANQSSYLSYKNPFGQYFKLGYISKRTDGPQQDDVSMSIGFISTYINLLTGVIFDTRPDNDQNSRLKKISLITQIKPPGDCWAINLYRDQKVGAEAEWKIRFDVSFDGKPIKVIPPAELNIN